MNTINTGKIECCSNTINIHTKEFNYNYLIYSDGDYNCYNTKYIIITK